MADFLSQSLKLKSGSYFSRVQYLTQQHKQTLFQSEKIEDPTFSIANNYLKLISSPDLSVLRQILSKQTYSVVPLRSAMTSMWLQNTSPGLDNILRDFYPDLDAIKMEINNAISDYINKNKLCSNNGIKQTQLYVLRSFFSVNFLFPLELIFFVELCACHVESLCAKIAHQSATQIIPKTTGLVHGLTEGLPLFLFFSGLTEFRRPCSCYKVDFCNIGKNGNKMKQLLRDTKRCSARIPAWTYQFWYSCKACNVDVCSTCATICHSKHPLREMTDIPYVFPTKFR